LKTRHTHEFDLPVSASAAANQGYPDKAKMKETILALRAEGWSYRQIAREVGLHWTRVGQILKDIERKSN
jgi:DNA-directed RNA polymerase specialized sigma24 family protein